MKRGGFAILWLTGMFALCPMLRANLTDASASPNLPGDSTETENPYSAIWTRNVFDLRPPEDKSASTANEAPPPANVKLIGIYTLFGKRALLSVQEQNTPGRAGPGRPAPAPTPGNKEEYYNMSEGERHGALEVLEINPAARSVKIKNDAIVSTLTFETNNNNGPSPIVGAPQHHPGVGPDANGLRPGRQFGQPNYSMPMPNRNMRSSPPNYGGMPGPNYIPPSQNNSFPGSSGYNPPSPLPNPNIELQPPTLTPEQQAELAAASAALRPPGSQSGGLNGLPAGVPPPPTGVPSLPPGLKVPNH